MTNVMYGVSEALVMERNIQDAVDLAWGARGDYDYLLVVEEWEEGHPGENASLVAQWVFPLNYGDEAPPLADPSHRVEVV